jgi:hypothetical protein
MNEPAFPTAETDGMTLRDYFAAEAMKHQEWVAYYDDYETERATKNDALRCYEIADAMLEARK